LDFTQKKEKIIIQLSGKATDPLDTVIVLEMNREADGLSPIAVE
jgi:hypothetical protein